MLSKERFKKLSERNSGQNMNIVFLKLYITNEVNNAFYNSQEIGLAGAILRSHPEHHIDIILLSKSVEKREDPPSDIPGLNIHILPGWGIGHHGFIDLSILRELNADLVHLLADNMFFAPTVIRYCLKNNIGCHLYIGTIITDSNNRLKQFMNKALIGRNLSSYRKVPVYAKTPFVLNQLHTLGVEAGLAPVGLDISALEPSGKSAFDIRKHYELSLDKRILLFVGRLEEYKRPMGALELIKSLSDKDKENRYQLLMIGDGYLSDKVDDRIREMKLQNTVRRIKKLPNAEMKDIYRACDVFINFNRVEIYGMAILESMANECPVVAMKAPGPEFLIDDGKTGFLCDSTDEMCKKILTLFSDDQKRRELTKNARKHVEESLTWDNTVACFEDWNIR